MGQEQPRCVLDTLTSTALDAGILMADGVVLHGPASWYSHAPLCDPLLRACASDQQNVPDTEGGGPMIGFQETVLPHG